MATVKKLIGRLPVYKGDWAAGTYSMLNQVSYLGSTFQSKIDNNTSQPATLVNNVLQVNSNWNVISNGTAAYLASDKITALEYNSNNSEIQSRKPSGLRFKIDDAAVYAESASKVNIGLSDFTLEYIGRGLSDINKAVFGQRSSTYKQNCLKISGSNTNTKHNGLYYVLFESPLSAGGGNSTANSIIQLKPSDATTNLHHIVIVRKGTLVTVYVNGRLKKTVTHDRVLTFDSFSYDVGFSTHYYGGRLFNYAMSESEALTLWNGGRYDEYVLPTAFKYSQDNMLVSSEALAAYGDPSAVKEVVSENEVRITHLNSGVEAIGVHFAAVFNSGYNIGDGYFIKAKVKTSGNEITLFDLNRQCYSGFTVSVTPDVWTDVEFDVRLTRINEYNSINNYIRASINNSDNGGYINVKDVEIVFKKSLLEYTPSGIKSDRISNSGILGSTHDLMYSTKKPNIAYAKVYSDKIPLEDKTTPDFHPIAVGQRCYTIDGKIFEAKLPAAGVEWSVSDWKQINNV